MTDKFGSKWSREETILAFDLYCKIPFSKISNKNEDIIKLANLIGRTPSSVGLKLSNLGHCDPVLAAKKISGMSNCSALDREIFNEFVNDWEELAYQAQMILTKYDSSITQNIKPEIQIDDLPEGIDRTTTVKTRVGQQFFRNSVLSAYNYRCCITGLEMPKLLIASHIKPWKVCDAKTERTNPQNGLCLNALHELAFANGLITLDKDYRIILSSKLKEAEMDESSRNWLASYDHHKILLPTKFTPGKQFIEYHNDVIFLK